MNSSRWKWIIVAVFAVMVTAGCAEDPECKTIACRPVETPTTPTPPTTPTACTLDVINNVRIGHQGGSANSTITTTQAWSLAFTSSWLSASTTSGSGSGQVAFSGPVNTGSERSVNVPVTGCNGNVVRTITVTQEATPTVQPTCTYGLSPREDRLRADGTEAKTARVTTQTGCPWTPTVDDRVFPWLHPDGSQRNGTGDFSYRGDRNQSAPRRGIITAGGQVLTVDQDGEGAPPPPPPPAACPANAYSANMSTTQPFPASGGEGVVYMRAPAGCPWTLASNRQWIGGGNAINGAGDRDVPFPVSENPDTAGRTGNIIASTPPQIGFSRDMPVSQNGVALAACTTVSVTPVSHTFDANGEPRATISVDMSRNNCPWSVDLRGNNWLSPSVSGGTGDGNFTVGASPNQSSGVRSAQIRVAERDVNFQQNGIQPAACTLDVTQPNARIPAQGGSVSASVTTNQLWSLSSTASWISASPMSAPGSSPITFSAGANPVGAGERTFNANVLGCNGGATRTIVVTQDAATPPPPPACTFDVSQASGRIPSGGGAVTVSINTNRDWTMSSSASWLSISPTNGSGSAQVSFGAQANGSGERFFNAVFSGCGGSASRTITQDALPAPTCNTPRLGASNIPVPAAGTSNGSLSVEANCPWTASSDSSWLRITGGASGPGNGVITYAIDGNTTPSVRVGTISVGSQRTTFTQAAGQAPPPPSTCTFTVICPRPSPGPLFPALPGTNGSLTVTASGPSCQWTSSSTQPAWLGVNPQSGTGTTVVSFIVGGNSTGAQRTGVLNIAGTACTFDQAGR